MTRHEKEKMKLCEKSMCKYFKDCLVFWGKDCVHQQGKRIPRLHNGEWVYYTNEQGQLKKRPRRGTDVMFD